MKSVEKERCRSSLFYLFYQPTAHVYRSGAKDGVWSGSWAHLRSSSWKSFFLIAGDWRPRFHPWPCSSGDSIPPCFNQFLGASRVSPGCQYGFTTFHLPVVVVGPDACIYIYTALNVGRFGHSIHRLSGRDLVVKPMLDWNSSWSYYTHPIQLMNLPRCREESGSAPSVPKDWASGMSEVNGTDSMFVDVKSNARYGCVWNCLEMENW